MKSSELTTLRGVNIQQGKQANKALLLKIIATQAPISRIKLSKIMHLSKMTISNLVNEYINDGIIFEKGIAEVSTGRKPLLLNVVADSLLTLGIYVCRDYIQAGIVDLKGASLRNERIQLSSLETEESFIRKLFMLTDSVFNIDRKANIWGIGIAAIGPLNIREGIILNPPHFHNIRNLNIVKPLSERYKLPTYLENDMNVSALAEMYFGSGQTVNNFIYVGITSGIGAGIVIDRKLYNGTRGFGGEIGHITVDINGNECECGNRGCLETYADVPAVLRWVKEEYAKQNLEPPELSWIWLIDAASTGNEICRRAIERQCRYISAAIVTAVNLFDPECVFIGGEIGIASDLTVKYLDQFVNQYKFSPKTFRVPVYPSGLPAGSTFIGTAALVLERNLEKDIPSD